MALRNINTAFFSTKIVRRGVLVVVAMMLAFALPTAPVSTVQADTFDEQIQALRNEVSSFQDQAASLREKASSLSNELGALQAEKNVLQAQIDLNEAELKRLKQEIIDTEKRINNQRELLSSNLRASYLESSVTPIEVLASSGSISDFIDKQEYRAKIQETIRLALQQIRELREKLNTQKKQVEQTLADRQLQRKDLAAKEQERANLLAQTQGQEAAFEELISERNDRISKLQAEQAALNAQLLGGNVAVGPACGGGYSGGWAWCTAPMNAYVDNWGMFSRQCVSYTAFKVWATGRHMPYWGGVGNANQWPGNARNAGIPVDGTPRPGDVAVWPVGFYGHTMYVEHVYDNGDIFISEYNFDWTGRYSERVISKSLYQAQGFEFIHF